MRLSVPVEGVLDQLPVQLAPCLTCLWTLSFWRQVHQQMDLHIEQILPFMDVAWKPASEIGSVSAQGTHLASASGDMSVKLWSFAKQKCVATFKGHKQAVWGVAWHDQGNFLASCSMDQSVRIWDFATGKIRQIFRCTVAADYPCQVDRIPHRAAPDRQPAVQPGVWPQFMWFNI